MRSTATVDIHVSTWPGWSGLTADITRFIALEGRVYSVAVSGLLSIGDVPADFPMIQQITADFPVLGFDGGSGIAGPDGVGLRRQSSAKRRSCTSMRTTRAFARSDSCSTSPAIILADVFETTVRRCRLRPAEFDDDEPVTGPQADATDGFPPAP